MSEKERIGALARLANALSMEDLIGVLRFETGLGTIGNISPTRKRLTNYLAVKYPRSLVSAVEIKCRECLYREDQREHKLRQFAMLGRGAFVKRGPV